MRVSDRKDWRGEAKAAVVAVLYALTFFAFAAGNYEGGGGWTVVGIVLAILTLVAAWVFFVSSEGRCEVEK